ncbi:MAG: hypothetical protein MUO54_02710 [Anaerolineales bacterium]|nr:hypothetical protein [Anaerolineales bacterium]
MSETALCSSQIFPESHPWRTHPSLLSLVRRPGFAPITYDSVDPRFGIWEDVDKIGKAFDLIIDFMVNHISRQSDFFQDYLAKGPGHAFLCRSKCNGLSGAEFSNSSGI